MSVAKHLEAAFSETMGAAGILIHKIVRRKAKLSDLEAVLARLDMARIEVRQAMRLMEDDDE